MLVYQNQSVLISSVFNVNIGNFEKKSMFYENRGIIYKSKEEIHSAKRQVFGKLFYGVRTE